MYGAAGNSSYAELISIAKKNAAEAKKRAANTHMFPETTKKRADPKQVKLKEGVAKFLAKKDEEERRQKELDRQKREKLLELRHQDRKATNRVRKMLSMTKSTNKSCMDDANDCLDASVTAQTAQGDFQPDEDDYGYTSNFADQMHKKIMEKYKALPVKPAFPQSRTPVPQPQSLSNRNNASWRNNKPEVYTEGDQSPEQNNPEENILAAKRKERLKKKLKQPPPPDYQQLLQLAQEKAQQPLPAVPLADKKQEKDEFEFGRPMTKKEKAAYLQQKELRERAARRFGLKPSDKNNNNASTSSSEVNGKLTASFKIPKANKSKLEIELTKPEVPPKKPKIAEVEHVKASTSQTSKARPSEPITNGHSSSFAKPSSLSLPKVNGSKSSSSPTTSRAVEKVKQISRSPQYASSSQSTSKPRERDPPPTQKSNGHHPKPETAKKVEKVMELVKERPRYLSAFEGKKEISRDRDQPRKQLPQSSDSRKPMKPSSSREMTSQGRSNEVRERSRDGNVSRGAPDRHYDQKPLNRDRQPPPQRRDMPTRRSPPRMRDDPPPHRMKPKFKGRAVIDSDEEYDSEMDDFIDDSEVDLGNISAEISRIFKYDRRRYDDDSDDECMESSVAEQLREEQRSLKLGIQEDMEDIRREEEEKRMKMLRMKKKARR